MPYKPQAVWPYRLDVRIEPTNPGSILAGQGSLTVQALVEWDSQEGKERPTDGELCVETHRIPLPGGTEVREARALALKQLGKHFLRMARYQEYLRVARDPYEEDDHGQQD